MTAEPTCQCDRAATLLVVSIDTSQTMIVPLQHKAEVTVGVPAERCQQICDSKDCEWLAVSRLLELR